MNSEVLPRVRMSDQVQGSSCHCKQRRTNGSCPDHGGVSPSPLLTPAGPQALLRWKVVQSGRGQLQQLRNVALISDVGQMAPSHVLTEEQEKNPRNCQQRVRVCHTPESNNSEYTLGNQLKSKPRPIHLGQTSSHVQRKGRTSKAGRKVLMKVSRMMVSKQDPSFGSHLKYVAGIKHTNS